MIPGFYSGGNARAAALLQVARRSACTRQTQRLRLVVLASVAGGGELRRSKGLASRGARHLALRYFDQLTRGCSTAEVPGTACAILAKYISQPEARPFAPPNFSIWRTRERVTHRAALRAEMVECVQAAARERGWTLHGDLASPALANEHTCPIHGDGPCQDGRFVIIRGCLFRQLVALRAHTDCIATEAESCQLGHASDTCEARR